jgi:hypothetical protein
MREAWPSVCGRCKTSFCRTSLDSPLRLRKSKSSGKTRLLVRQSLCYFLLLTFDVALVSGLNLDLLDDLRITQAGIDGNVVDAQRHQGS